MKLFVAIICLLVAQITYSQVINGYAQVTGIAGNVLALGTVDEAGDTFEDDEYVIIMQMQDNVIGSTANNVGFGSLGSIQNAGRYEVRQISTHTETAGTPTTITLQNNPNFTYNFNANSTVQIITFTQLGNPDFT